MHYILVLVLNLDSTMAIKLCSVKKKYDKSSYNEH